MKRNKFSLSHYKLLTTNMGQLIPLTWYEALPGDTIQQRSNMLIRLSPLLAPVMHPVRVRVHHWFVPYRLIWDDFEDFITGGEDGLDATTPPTFAGGAITEGTLEDYMGIPVSTGCPAYSALPFRAYNLIYNEHYRDQQLVTEVAISKGNGTDATTVKNIQRVSWEKDYFTTARPYEQLGTEVTIPLAGSADVDSTGDGAPTFDYDNQTGKKINAKATSAVEVETAPSGADNMVWNDPKLVADLSSATGVSINDLRLYLALQRYKENRNEFGSRYTEYLRFLGVRSSDARLQNPEYLGGGRQLLNFSEVLSTADSGTDVVGSMRGHGITGLRTNRYRRFFEEHGLVMTLMSVVPKAIYSDGLHRSWSKTTKEDYFQKELAHIGDQAILDGELYADAADPTTTFGFQSRFDEYRHMPSGIAGEFQSSLNHWHYARLLGSEPSLNQSFIECNPTKRQYADNASDVLYVMANHSVQARRMIPKYPRKRII